MSEGQFCENSLHLVSQGASVLNFQYYLTYKISIHSERKTEFPFQLEKLLRFLLLILLKIDFYSYYPMKVHNYAMLFIILMGMTYARPWIRQLTDSNTADTDPSTNADCIEAKKISACNYNDYKLKKAETCYDSAESKLTQSLRQILFCKQCLKAVEINKLYLAGITQQTFRYNMQYLDCSQDEINIKRGIIDSAKTQNIKRILEAPTSSNPNIRISDTLPSSRNYVPYMSPVRDRKNCWASTSFAATEIYQMWLRFYNFNYTLSRQAALQCTSFYSPSNSSTDCNGGNIYDSLYFYAQVGGVLQQDYPYISHNYGFKDGYRRTKDICTEENRIYLGSAQAKYQQDLNITQVKTLLVENGPLLVRIYNDANLQNYNGTYVYSCQSDVQPNLAVLLYGWNSQGDWLVKNYWGVDWGYHGTMWLSSTNDCGLSHSAAYLKFNNIQSNVQVVKDPGYNSQFYNFSVMALLALLFVTFFY